jgi:hypothetical protein
MGAMCNSTTDKKNNTKKEEIYQNKSSQDDVKKPLNPHSIIKNIKSQTIIKAINDLNGDALQLENCVDSTIIIMDMSAQVIIEKCTNCRIFIAPCKGSIFLRNSKEIYMISASHQFRCRDIQNCVISIYSSSPPAIEKCENLKLGCFCFRYTELPLLFSKAELCIWKNMWSEYVLFPNSQPNGIVEYFEVISDKDFINKFTQCMKDHEISIDHYEPVPFTHGLSLPFTPEYKNVLIFLKESHVETEKLYGFFSDENLRQLSAALIRTDFLSSEDQILKELLPALSQSKGAFFKNQVIVH